MSELPDRPDLSQLRREARELLRAATSGEPRAVARLRGVSERVTLSAAQLAVAREYGCRSWPALRVEVERRRLLPEPTASPPLPAGEGHGLPDAREEWRSFGGTAFIDVAAGDLFPQVLINSPDRAVLHARMTRPGNDPNAPGPFSVLPPGQWRGPQFADVTIVDDQGARYAFHVESAHGSSGQSMRLRCVLSPDPGRAVTWLELRGPDGAAIRLLPSPRPVVRVGQLAPAALSPAERKLTDDALWLIGLALTMDGEVGDDVLSRYCSAALRRVAEIQRSGELDPASPLPGQLARLCAALIAHRPADDIPSGWSAMLDAAQRADGPRYHLDLGVVLPPIDDVAVRADALLSEPDGWRLYLRAMPAWWKYSEDRQRKWSPVSVHAADDRGGRYVGNFGGSTASRLSGCEELILRYLPRLDPNARALKLTFRGTTDEVAVDLDLPLTAES
jgi:hypothetical protein